MLIYLLDFVGNRHPAPTFYRTSLAFDFNTRDSPTLLEFRIGY